MAIFTAIGALFTAISTFTIGGFAIGSALLQAAVGIGINLLAQAVAGKPKPQTFAINGTLQAGGDVPRSFIMGRYATAGSLVWGNTWGYIDDTPNAYLTQVIAVSDLPVGGLVDVWVNGEKVTLLTGEPNPDGLGYPVDEYRKDGQDNLWIKFHDGTQTTADSFLTSKASTGERGWASSRVGYGVAYAIATARITKNMFSGFPSFKFVLDGVKFYDITKDDTAGGDGDQRFGDPATWGGDGDHLPAVQAYNLLRGLSYGGEWFYGLQGIGAARLPPANWLAQVAKCRAEIDGADGPEPTYRSGGEIAIDAPLASALEAINTACQGRISEVGGVYSMFLGEPGSPSFSFTDDDIISTEEQSFTPFFGLADTINGIVVSYPSPNDGWVMKPGPALHDAALEALHGNRQLMADVDLAFVPYPEQAQRLQRSALLEGQRARRHTHVLPPSFWPYLVPGEIGSWTSARNGYTTKLFRVDGAVDRANLDVMGDLTEVDPSDFNWDTEADYEPPVDGPVGPIRPTPAPIIDWFAEPATITNGSDLRPGLKLTWDGTKTGVVGVEFQVRLTSTLEIAHQGRTDDAASGAILISQNLFSNTLYGVRGRYILDGQDALWSDWLSVTTPNVRDTDVSVALANATPGFLALLSGLVGSLNNIESRMEQIALNGSEVAGSVSNESSVSRRFRDAIAVALTGQKATITETGGALKAFSEAFTAVSAQVGGSGAEGLFQITSEATPGDAQARIGLTVRATANGAFKTAAMVMDALASGKARIGFVADQIGFIVDGVLVGVFDEDGLKLNNALIANLDASNITADKLDAAEILQDGTLITDLFAFNAVTEYGDLGFDNTFNYGGGAIGSAGIVDQASVTLDNPAGNAVIEIRNLTLINQLSGSGAINSQARLLRNGSAINTVTNNSNNASVPLDTVVYQTDGDTDPNYKVDLARNWSIGGSSSGSTRLISRTGILFWKR